MSKKPRSFSAETKLAIVKRLLAGEEVKSLAKELKLHSRTFLYKWKDRYRKFGEAGFRVPRGRPPKKAGVADPQVRTPDDLEAARQRIAELERKIGQQQLELDFFRQALRQVRETRRSSNGPGAKPSTSASKR
jgi:transposase-like protein